MTSPILKFDPKTAAKQDFSIPSSILYYIQKNPLNITVYLKVIKICKYFYSSTDPVPYSTKTAKKNVTIFFNQNYHHVSIENFKQIDKIWLTNDLSINGNEFPSIYYSTLLNKVYRCDLLSLNIYNQNVTYEQFKLLTLSKTIQHLYISSVVKYKNDNIVPLEEIVQHVPNLKQLLYDLLRDESSSSVITAETVKKMVKFLNPLKLELFYISDIPPTFDFDTFLTFMRTNPKIDYQLYFCHSLPTQYIQKLQKIVNEIIAAGEATEYPPPDIYFPELSENDVNAIQDLRLKYYKLDSWEVTELD